MNELDKLTVAGSGEAGESRRDLFDARVRATVRYADPAAWTTATAVANALAGAEELLAKWQHEIGMIAISDQGPGGTIAEVLAEGTRGFSQPMHYAAASPGTLVGVPCIAFGLRGPTMNLTMIPQDGIPVALTLCAGWLERKIAKLMIIATCSTSSSGTMMSRALLLAPSGFSGSGTPLTESVINWLTAVEPASGASA
ncbi:MAG: hypothetical protein ABR990_10635 [Terracidiphilus sp.]|jgi:hypothetical protein